jgi:type III restriction enzyme
MTGDQPTYRDLWLRIREHLPKKGRKTEDAGGEPKLPLELQGALLSLYGNYEKYYRLWEKNAEARARGITPPVFIVVCNNTNVSKLAAPSTSPNLARSPSRSSITTATRY